MKGPQAYGGSPASLWLYVDDCDALFNRAAGAGAKVEVPLGDQFWGDRGGAVSDPTGYGTGNHTLTGAHGAALETFSPARCLLLRRPLI